MALEISNSFWAQCSVDAGNPPAYVYSRGFAAAITRNGVGDYTLTLDQGIDSTQSSIKVTPRQSPGAIVSAVHVSDTDKRIRTFNAVGAAADIDFDVLVLAVPTQ